MSQKISARNQFAGTVTAVTPGAVNSEVELTLPGGDRIVAILTQGSVRELGLAVGTPATAIVKAPWVIVTAGHGGLKFSSRNQLRGSVSEVKKGAVNDEVAITLPGGAVVHAVITHDSVGDMGLKVGDAATALIKASHVVLGV